MDESHRRSGTAVLAPAMLLLFFTGSGWPSAAAQKCIEGPSRPFAADSSSKVSYGPKGFEITNVRYSYENIPDRGRLLSCCDRYVLLRHTNWRIGDDPDPSLPDKATATVEAWPIGVDPNTKPLYAIKADFSPGAKIVDGVLLVFQHGFRDYSDWSVYRLEDGRYLFKTSVEMFNFRVLSGAPSMADERYVGFELPDENPPDPRLREPHVAGVLTYASADHVIREALLTSDDPDPVSKLDLVAGLQSLSMIETLRPGNKGKDAFQTIRLDFDMEEDVHSKRRHMLVPIKGDDLDLAHAKLPPGVHITKWAR
jgi:hypothetical protein